MRSADGIYFTKAGARKLAHYVEREIDRSEANRAVPVALPSTLETAPAGAKAGGPSARPLVGPVVPLTVSTTGAAAEELLGGARPATTRPANPDPLTTRVLIKGEPIAAPTGRADDFNWPRGSAATVTTEPISPSPTASASSGSAAAAAGGTAQPKTAKPAAPAPGTASVYQRLEVDGAPDETKPKVARKPAPAPAPVRPAPFANIPNIFR